MRIVHLVPGTGNFHCGACLRDQALMKALIRDEGHDVTVVPLYLPLVVDEDEPGSSDAPVFLGGINLFLQQKSGIFRHTPRWLDQILDSRTLLAQAAGFAGMTRARDLAEMTLESFKGAEGLQGKEWRRLLDWLAAQLKPDVVSLSNGLLIGIARSIQAEMGVPVVSSLQGEDGFLDSLPDPHRERCWNAFIGQSRFVARFVAVSRFYGERMGERLGLGADQVRVVFNGIDVSAFSPAASPPAKPAIGYLARMCHAKGLHTLVRAFLILKRTNKIPGLRLEIGGAQTNADHKYVDRLRSEIEAAGQVENVGWHPNLSADDKHAFLRTLSVFSVPSLDEEAFGLSIVEAMASGVPVVQPRRGAYPEIIDETGGGIIIEPGSEEALAAGLEELLCNEKRRRELGETGRNAVSSRFTATRMAKDFANVLKEVVEGNPDRSGSFP